MKKINKLITAALALSFVIAAVSPVIADAKNDKDKNDKKDNAAKVGLFQGFNLNLGMQKRLDDGKPLPPGWLKRIDHWKDRKHDRDNNNGNGTTTSTTTRKNLPKITDVKVVKSTSTASVTWKTNELTTGELRFSTVSPLPTNATLLLSTTMATSHTLALNNLSANTKYFFTLSIKDADGNVKTSEVRSFKTNAVAGVDATLPKILWNTVVDVGTNAARFVWATNEPATSKIWVSTTSPVSMIGTANVTSNDFLYLHDFQVSGLASSTVHYYAITSTDVGGNVSVTTTGSFKTK